MDKTDIPTTNIPTNYLNETYELLKRDPTPSLQRKLISKMFSMRKANMINLQTYYRLCRCSVARPPKLYGLPKLHKPLISMRPIVSFSGLPTYELSKYLTTILQPLTNKSQHKLQSTENFIAWRHQNGTNTRRLQTSVFRHEITVHQYSTSTGARLHKNCQSLTIHWRTPLLIQTTSWNY